MLSHNIKQQRLVTKNTKKIVSTIRYADAYRNEMVAFVDCAHEGKETPVGVEDGRAAYLIGKAAKQSMETGLVSTHNDARVLLETVVHRWNYSAATSSWRITRVAFVLVS